MSRQSIIRGTILALGFLPAVALASPAYLRNTTELHAGPDYDYPTIDVIREGDGVEVHGCLNDWSWCDVGYVGLRGWIAADELLADWDSRRAPIFDVGPRMGLGVLSFSFSNYWDSYYRDRPFYRERTRWQSFDRDHHHNDRGPRTGGNKPGPDRTRDRDHDHDRNTAITPPRQKEEAYAPRARRTEELRKQAEQNRQGAGKADAMRQETGRNQAAKADAARAQAAQKAQAAQQGQAARMQADQARKAAAAQNAQQKQNVRDNSAQRLQQQQQRQQQAKPNARPAPQERQGQRQGQPQQQREQKQPDKQQD